MERKRTYGVWAVRSSTSIFGPAQSWCKENGKPLEFDSKADAENYAKEYLDKLEKTTLREKLKRAKTVVSTQEVSSHKRGLER